MEFEEDEEGLLKRKASNEDLQNFANLKKAKKIEGDEITNLSKSELFEEEYKCFQNGRKDSTTTEFELNLLTCDEEEGVILFDYKGDQISLRYPSPKDV